MVALGRLRDESDALVQNAHAHALPSYPRRPFALLLPDG